MRIDAVDFYYLSMPEVLDIGDGSQDLLLVRLQAGPHVGWGECEAAPLVSIASLICPMSHSACKPVIASVLGQRIDDVGDICLCVFESSWQATRIKLSAMKTGKLKGFPRHERYTTY